MWYRRPGFIVFLFLAPALIFFTLYIIAPIPVSFSYSLHNWDGIGGRTFIGLRNWGELLKDPIFWRALRNNITLVVISIAVQLPMGIILAVILSNGKRFIRLLKTVYFLPYLMSSVAIGMLWRYIYEPNFGLLNMLLEKIGKYHWIQDWLGDPKVVLYSVINAVNWQFIPFYMILFMAALVGIPEELYEAAKIDGASGWSAFWRITLPLLWPTVANAAILSLTGSLKYFDLIHVLSGGGPNHASELLATYMYKRSFHHFRMGYGSTVAVALFTIGFMLSMIFIQFSRKRDYQGGAGL
ncbi:MAG: sugar ABC transporter permease [Firmicutes bacterium]|nr:sugar ABC transporter permease [Bacillota bacterium]